MKTMTPPLKWHGGKQYLADKIIGLMPPRCRKPNAPAADDPGWLHYVEPYFGGGAVLFANDPEGISEVLNDVNGDLSRFWRVLRDGDSFRRFLRLAEATPFSRSGWDAAGQTFVDGPDGGTEPSDEVNRAWRFFVRCRQSLAGG